MRNALIEFFAVVGEFLHAVSKRALGSALQCSDLRGQHVAVIAQLPDTA